MQFARKLKKDIVQRFVDPFFVDPFIDKASSCGTHNLLVRELWLEKTLASVPAGSRVLDAGAGELRYKRFCTHLDYVSQDFAQYDGRGDGIGLQMGSWDQSQLDIISDIVNIPQPDVSFDAIMCIEVLEHLPEPVSALREFLRLLRTGGIVILTAPFCSLTHYSPYFYQTGYGRYFYEYWLDEIGFEIVNMQWNGNYFEYLGQELRRLPAIGKQFATGNVSWLERWAVQVVLSMLNRFSGNDSGSEQLLAFGLHVVARKR